MSQLVFQVAFPFFQTRFRTRFLLFRLCFQPPVLLSPDRLGIRRINKCVLSHSERRWNARGSTRLVSDTALVNAERRALQPGVAAVISSRCCSECPSLGFMCWTEDSERSRILLRNVLNTLEDMQNSMHSIRVYFSFRSFAYGGTKPLCVPLQSVSLFLCTFIFLCSQHH